MSEASQVITHVLDAAEGVPAQDVRVRLEALRDAGCAASIVAVLLNLLFNEIKAGQRPSPLVVYSRTANNDPQGPAALTTATARHGEPHSVGYWSTTSASWNNAA